MKDNPTYFIKASEFAKFVEAQIYLFGGCFEGDVDLWKK